MRKKSATRSAFGPAATPMFGRPVACSCKSHGPNVNQEPISVADMLPEEQETYCLLAEWNDDTSVIVLLDHLVDVAMSYVGELIDADDYWERIMPKASWIEELRPLVSEGLETYLRQLEAQLTATSTMLEMGGTDPYNDKRRRTLAATETTMARTAGTVILLDLNNTLIAIKQGEI